MKSRLLKSSILVGFIFFVDLYVCCKTLLDLFQNKLITEVVFNENLIINDYHSLLKYSVLYMFLFVFYIKYVISKERIEIVIRYVNKQDYYKTLIKRVFVASIIFSFIHEIESVIFSLLYGSIEMLIEHGWIQGEIMQLVACTLFYMIVFFVYKIINTWLASSIAQFLTVILFSGIYYVSIILVEPKWFLLKDLDLLHNLCGGIYSYEECGLALVRWFLVWIILCTFFLECAKRREYIKNEKK